MDTSAPGAPLDRHVAAALRVAGARREPGTEIFVSALGEFDGPALLAHALGRQRLARQVLLVRIVTGDVPHVPVARQAASSPVGDGVALATVTFGFDDRPDLPKALTHLPGVDPAAATFVVSEERLDAEAARAMRAWQRWLLWLMLRRSQPAARYYRLPPGRTLLAGRHPAGDMR